MLLAGVSASGKIRRLDWRLHRRPLSTHCGHSAHLSSPEHRLGRAKVFSMEAVLFVSLFGAVLWLADHYHASKFRYFYPELSQDLLPKGAPRWTKTWVYKNQALKHAGLIFVWIGFASGTYLPSSRGIGEVNPFFAVGFTGLVLYIGSRIWPALVREPRSRHKS